MKGIVLALDLGTKTGWCIGDATGVLGYGTKNLEAKGKQPKAQRYVNLIDHLNALKERYKRIDYIAYEQVRGHLGVSASHVYGGLEATVMTWCIVNQLPYMDYEVGEIKKSFTNKGNASKEEMVAKAVDLGFDVEDDNSADAIAIYKLAITPKVAA